MAYMNNEQVVKTFLAGGAVDLTPSGSSTNPLANKSISQNFSNVLKGIKSGEAVTVDDVSPIEHSITIKTSSKNMLDLSKAYFINYDTQEGFIGNLITNNNTIRFEKMKDGNYSGSARIPVFFEKGTYTISFTASSDATGNMGWAIYDHTNYNTVIKKIVEVGTQTTVAYTESFNIETDGLYDVCFYMGYTAAAGTHVSFEKPQLEKGGTPTEYTPFVDVSTVTVTGYKGNIANIPDITFTGYTYNMKDYLQWYIDLPMGAKFTVSANGNILNGGGATNWRTYLADGSSVWLFNGLVTDGARKSVTATKTKHFELTDVTSSLLYCGTPSDTDFGQYYYKNFTINIGDKDLGYDAYEPQTYSPDADGNIKITSFYPNMSFVPDTDGVTLDLEYNRDVNKAFAELQQAIISLEGIITQEQAEQIAIVCPSPVVDEPAAKESEEAIDG